MLVASLLDSKCSIPISPLLCMSELNHQRPHQNDDIHGQVHQSPGEQEKRADLSIITFIRHLVSISFAEESCLHT